VASKPPRLLRLLTLLQARSEWSAADLAQRLGVSTRTVRRDVGKLRELDYPVHAGIGPGARYRLGPGAALPPLMLDDEEAIAVVVALRTAAGGLADIGETALRALIKVQQVLPSRLRHRTAALQIDTIPVTGAVPVVDAELLVAVAAACRDHQQLRFDYRTRDGDESLRHTEPHRLVVWGRRWYLVAWDIDRAEWRSFRVDRLRPRTPVGPRFAPRPVPGGDAAAFVSRAVADVWPVQTRVRLHASADTIRPRLWPVHGRLEPVDDRSCLLYLGADSPRMIAYLLTHLDVDFTIESPPGFGDDLRAVADRFARAAATS
jgi:predicted DNA-binding transcriptional regulator YafY